MVLTDLAIIWQLLELKRLHKFRIDLPIFLIFTMVGELIFVTTRLVILVYIDPPSFIHLYDEPTLTAAVRWILFSLTTLSYIAIIAYSLRKITIENTQTIRENQKITELLKEKEHLIYGLLKANKTAATGALSASIAHELNQPLGAANLNIQFLKMKLEKGVLNPELGKEILDSLEEDNKRAATIVRSLRSIFTEGESNAQEVRLSDLIAKVLDIVKPELKNKNIQIQLRVDDDLVIRVNSSEIEQVILNLLNNAAQALANSGTLQRRIAIEAIKTGNSVQLSISDNGAGVPEDFKSQLFELLSTTKQTGMGLGLWLCKHIVTRYSGSIHYEDAVGGGAKFVIELPLN
ncbi:ATP-binding protein [Polynucleobacter sp. MWH-Adler-W8]|uniref:sensor histidine kinase n=1 Tax=Polynucleobacter sp. MWH-Adler-W8 TaxID=1819727 RepID=UPI0013018422|nr:ATP-binding protein [Polynucleobacter sp. MWH-Adler-W8]